MTDMPHPVRRIAERRLLRRPLEARLLLCRGESATGWIVDEQDDGLGMAFGSEDVARLADHVDCCVGGPVDLYLEGYTGDSRPIPVRLAHVTHQSEGLECRAGLAFDVTRMTSQDVAHLLQVWRRLVAASS